MATPVVSPYTFADLRSPRDVAANKFALYQALVDNGHTQAMSWADETPQAALVEVEADAQTNYQAATAAILECGFNEWAEGEALREHSRQVYGNAPRPGKRTLGRFLLNDTGSGPFDFDATSVSFSVGQGGLQFDGVPNPVNGASTVHLDLNGAAFVYAEAAEEGVEYNVSVGRVRTFSRGILPGVEVTNPPGWLTAAGTQQGASPESEPSLRVRNIRQWETLSVGSTQGAYEKRIRDADVAITRVEAFTNLDLLDPGCLNVIIAGDAGALPPDVVMRGQGAVAPAQIGGDKIPETARVVVSSAVNNAIFLAGTIYVPGERLDAAFQAQVFANLRTFEKALRIGARVSYERTVQVLLSIAGLDPGVIDDADSITLNGTQRDVVQFYYQAAVFDTTAVRFLPV